MARALLRLSFVASAVVRAPTRAVGSSTPTASCITYSGELVGPGFPPRLELPVEYVTAGASLGGNFYGARGRTSSLEICMLADPDAGTVGWNFTRGATEPQCREPEVCSAPECYSDFAFANLGLGTGPFAADAAAAAAGDDEAVTVAAGQTTGSGELPVNLDSLDRLVVSQNVSWSWRDAAPGVRPPQTGGSRRTRLIYDFFLTTAKPNGSNIASTITDEITISLAANPDFPGSQPPGCWDNASRFEGRPGPVLANAVFDGYHHYDYWYTDHHDAVPGTGTRFSSFRRVGATAVGAQAPQHVDIIPFIAAVRKMWPGEEVRPGPWLGHMSIATELYDYVVGEVTFAAPPTIKPQPKLQIK